MTVEPSTFGSPLTAELATALCELLASTAPSELEAATAPAPASSPTPAIPRRERLDGSDGSSVEVTDSIVVVGRRASTGAADLAAVGPTVSRRHVAVWRNGSATLCRDLGSRNGTFRRRDGELHEVPGPTGGATLLLAGDELVTVDGSLLAVLADDVLLDEHEHDTAAQP